MDTSYIILIPFIPLAVFLLLGIFNQKIKPKVSGYVGVLGLLASTVLSLYASYQYFFNTDKVNGVYQTFVEKTVWMNFTDTLRIDMGILIDPISVMMLVVVSIVSLMVHIYSRGYMKGDGGYTKFFAFLSLFTFSMFGLAAPFLSRSLSSEDIALLTALELKIFSKTRYSSALRKWIDQA